MKEQLVQDLTKEQESISTGLKEKRMQESELDKALVATRKEISTLEGRLMEVNAIIEYVKGVESAGEPEIRDTPEVREPAVETLEN